ncbi:MAG: DNA repair protein RecO [Deltaproteobacteria bacterium]|nr:DNA repair protein RecO [Deltaproteobacteria bacterium]
MVEERTPAIVLRGRAHGESDKIVTFLTRDWGKVTGIAKGAKRSQRRFVNVLEPFTYVQLRFRPIRADELAFIFGCDLLRSFRAPSRDLQRYGFASYLTELIDVMVAGREAGPELFELLLQGLTVLEEAELPSLFLSAFELLLLVHTGYAPNIEGCQRCGLPLTESDNSLVSFSPSLGGLLCVRCRDTGGATVRLSHDTLQILENPQSTQPTTLLLTQASPQTCRELRAIVTGLLTRHITRPLKSRAFLEQTGLLTDSLVDDARGE